MNCIIMVFDLGIVSLSTYLSHSILIIINNLIFNY